MLKYVLIFSNKFDYLINIQQTTNYRAIEKDNGLWCDKLTEIYNLNNTVQ